MTGLRAVDDVIVHEEGGDAFLLHVGSGRYYGLNRSGMVVWRAIVDGADPVRALADTWPERSRDALRTDAHELIDGLLEAGLVTEGP